MMDAPKAVEKVVCSVDLTAAAKGSMSADWKGICWVDPTVE
jgi:hypothetical protein